MNTKLSSFTIYCSFNRVKGLLNRLFSARSLNTVSNNITNDGGDFWMENIIDKVDGECRMEIKKIS